MRNLVNAFCASICMVAVLSTLSFAEKGLAVKTVRYFSYAGFTRIVFEIEATAPYVIAKSADGRNVMLRAYEGVLTATAPLPTIKDGAVAGIELKDEEGSRYILIHLDAAAAEVKDFVLRGPDRIVLDIMKGGTVPSKAAVRQESIVLDAGHGGAKDAGIVSGRGVEKTLTLEWAHALRKLLKKKELPFNPVVTREKDQPLSFNDRAGIANASGAAVFVSLHAAPGRNVRVFLLDPEDEPFIRTPSSRSDFLGFEAESEHQEMLWMRQQAAYAQESGLLGRLIVGQLEGKGGPDPIQAPLAALRPVAAAAVVVEIGTEVDAGRVLEAIGRGIERYVRERR